jgi:hypothetical protein
LPGVANVAGEMVAGVQQLLSIGFGLEIAGLGACNCFTGVSAFDEGHF